MLPEEKIHKTVEKWSLSGEQAFYKKKDLLEKMFGRILALTWRL